MKRWFLTLLIAFPAAAEPHAWITFDGAPLPPNPEQPKRGSFNRMTNRPSDAGSLTYYRGLQVLEAERRSAERQAELSAPRIETNVHQNTIVVQPRLQHRGGPKHGKPRWRHHRGVR